MDTTRTSLIHRVRDPNNHSAWDEFARLYRPILVGYARSWGFSQEESEDFAQECLSHLIRVLPDFEYSNERKGFKKWMRVVIDNIIRMHLRRRKEAPARTGDFNRSQHREENPEDHWNRIWMVEHLRFCLEKIRPRLNAINFEAFRLYMLEEWPVAKICDKLDVNANRVYIARTRISNMLRQEMILLIGEDSFD